MNKEVMVLIVGMLLLTTVSADEYYTQNTEVDLKIICLNNGFCSASAGCNTTILGPNEEVIVVLAQFQNQNSYHNYTLNETQTSTQGEYSVKGYCLDGGSFQEVDYNFYVTGNGEPNPHGIVIFGFGLLFLFLLSSSVVIILKSIGHLVQRDFGLMELGIAWGAYFALLMAGRLAHIYLGNLELTGWLDLFITIYGFPMVMLPAIAFFLSFFNAQNKKKREAQEW